MEEADSITACKTTRFSFPRSVQSHVLLTANKPEHISPGELTLRQWQLRLLAQWIGKFPVAVVCLVWIFSSYSSTVWGCRAPGRAALTTAHLLYTATAYSLTHCQLQSLPTALPTVKHLKIRLKLTCGFKFYIEDCFRQVDLLWSGMIDLWMGGAFPILNMYLGVIQPNCLPTEEMCLLYSQYCLILERNSV